MRYDEAVKAVLAAAMAVLAVGSVACLVRAVIGPTHADRLIAANMTGTQMICMICIHAARTGEHGFTDVALIFAMFSFLAAAVLVRIVTERRKDR
jgi:multicomponent Na+:H+ antiporter subunit F